PSQPSSSLLPPPSPPPPPPSFPTRRSSDLRFYDVTGGAIRIGGHDVRDLTTDSLRAAIGLVPEDSFLFSDTVRSNIAYGLPDATDEQIAAAASAAQADRFITELPDGYDTKVGEHGLTLSGGQRQRVALARAILT